MNAKFKEFLKTIADVTPTYTYEEIVNELSFNINETAVFGSRKVDPSCYFTKYIDIKNSLYITLRIGDHLPTIQHFLNSNTGMPSNKEYAHNCFLLLGKTEYEKLHSEKGNHKMSSKRVQTKMNVDTKTFKEYSLPIDIPYHIYHFIPELFTKNDITILSNAANNWLNSNGDKPLIIPERMTQNVFYKNHDNSSISSIDCNFHIEPVTLNEKVYLVGGQEPVLFFDMGYMTLVAPDGKEMTLHGYLEINKCDDMSFNILSELKSIIDANDVIRKKNTLTEDAKREIYYMVMRKMSKILKEELDL